MRTPSIFAATAIVLLATSVSIGQEPAALFDWTFDGGDDPHSSYAFQVAEQQMPNCATVVDNSDVVSSEFAISTGDAVSKLDTSEWVIEEFACTTEARWGLGLGHDMTIGAKQSFTSDDLSAFELSFDAWGTGADGLEGLLRVQFLEVEDNETIVRAELENVLSPMAGNLGLLLLESERQTFTTTLDKLEFADGFMLEDLTDNLTSISGVNFEFAGKGVSGEADGEFFGVIGIDNDNEFFVDNIKLVAPFDELPTLTIQNAVVNNNGGTASDTNWVLSATDGADFTVMGASGGSDITNVNVPIGNYILAAGDGPEGYGQTGFSCTGNADTNFSDGLDLASGENVVCTFSQDDLPPFLTLRKEVVNDSGGTATDANWTLTATGPKELSGAEGTAGVTNVEVDAGTYELDQDGPDGYALSGLSCTGGSDVNPSNGLAIGLGENIVCTLVDDDISPKLTIRKNIINDDGGSATAADWTVAASGPTNISGAAGSAAVTNAEVNAGEYNVGDFPGGPSGYARTSLACTGGADTDLSNGLSIELGENIICTITDDDISANLTLVNTVVNDHGGTAVASDWNLAAVGPDTISGSEGDAWIANVDLKPGTYKLSESGGPDGYELTNLSCTGPLDGDLLSLGLGETVICTFVQDDIEIEEVCDPNTMGDVDGDGTVGFGDFLVLSSNFGLEVADHTQGDLNCDGEVSFADFLTQSTFFGQTVGGAEAVPEPSSSSLALLAFVAIGLMRRRR